MHAVLITPASALVDCSEPLRLVVPPLIDLAEEGELFRYLYLPVAYRVEGDLAGSRTDSDADL
jgi:hypothetical protein